ncbi:TraB/GumN family protein [Paraclostridium bifermentans]|uniref:TraB/GumN family protein n=1 Tax=Paraclostridium bifermentans TaxID=1490 RepID=A0AA44DNF0_PARBF|nr:TraB/GumN family protein [Paraclostridium bifermentans]MBN8049125.1 TraB/GumN family protein [Paraclostridium bifermentans]NME10813.1 TraB/GumN family protein [Paraclostridium bifermentans]
MIFIFIFISKSNSKNTAQGFYWEAKKDNKSIYLIGTIHVSKKEVNFLNDNLKYILDNTQALATETNSKDMDPEFLKSIDSKKFLTKGELKDFLTDEEKNQLDEILKYFNLEYSDVSNLSIFGLNSLILQEIDSIDELDDEGLDMYLENQYKRADKDTVSLETLYDTEGLIKELLGGTKFLNIKDIKDEINNRKIFIDEFKDGNELFFENNFKNGIKEVDAETYNLSIKDRNKNMANKINSLFKENKNYAVAIGIGHFVGDDSVLSYLENLGYRITKLDK